jgi:hypothetical protein
MRSKKIALAAAIVFSIALPASAATKYHRVIHADRPIYNYVHQPIYNMVAPASVDGGCPANGGPGCSNAGPAPPDSW